MNVEDKGLPNPGAARRRSAVAAMAPAGGRAGLDAEQAHLHREAWRELMRRADRGIHIHLPFWVLLGAGSGLATTEPVFYAANIALFTANLAARLWLRRRLARHAADTPAMRAAFLTLLLASPAHWGLLSGLAVYWPPLYGSSWPLWVITWSVAAAGTMGLSISTAVRWGYPLAAGLPAALGLLLSPTPEHLALILMGVFAGRYMVVASQAIHDDYWTSIRSRRQLELSSREFEQASLTDALTRIGNRLCFEQRIGAEWELAVRRRLTLAVLMIDIDHFKRINDTHGHPVGDRCLEAVAAALRERLERAGDVLARYGGEEFVVLLPNTDVAAAALLAERLRAGVAAMTLPLPMPAVRLTCSVGVASAAPRPGSRPSLAVDAADRALYRAKQQGRDRVVLAGPGDMA